YLLRAYRQIFMGPKPAKLQLPADIDWGTKLPLVLLLVTLIAVGFVPELLNQFIRPAIESLFSVTTG
ncbi:MAG: hypothetical protein KBF76_13705, partial [Verrucomicrobiales bacterium]|nr:hypothetical protein [Verrucomicrobiales bacterium]